MPAGAPASTSSSSAAQLNAISSAAQIPASSSDTTVFTAYVTAASAGLYRVSAPAVAGNVDVFVGNVWVTGTRSNLPTVLGTPDPATRDESGQMWLQAGVHPISVVFGRNSEYAGFGYEPQMWLRWAQPGSDAHNLMSLFR